MMVLKQIRERINQLGADALLVTNPANVRYLSQFRSPEDGRVFISNDQAVLITDGRYIAQADQESSLEVEIAPQSWLAYVSEKAGNLRLALEADHLTHSMFEKFAEALSQKPIASNGLVAELRLHKSPKEIDLLKEAARITDAAFGHILNYIRAGVQEIDVALELERFMRKQGAESKSFEIIVASGYRSAMPHGVASDKVIEMGDLVTLDFGAKFAGYHADMTRAVAVGEISDELKAMYDAVLEAQTTALNALAPGKNGQELDALARSLLAKAGLEQYFSHGLGHGVGLDIHEGPRLSKQVSQVLEPGMAVTVEPGVYIPGNGGVRIEDLAVITESGFERLSLSSKDFVQV